MDSKIALVVGLGQIGYSNAEYMTMKGLTVDGYDKSHIGCPISSKIHSLQRLH